MPADFSPEILDELLSGGLKPADLTAEDGLFRRLKKALLERALGAELTHHVGYEKGDPAGRGTGNSRNGTSRKTLLSEDGEMEIEVSPDLISKVTDAVLGEVRDWQSRPLETIYPIVFFDALRVKIRDEGLVKNKAVYVVLGIKPSGEKEVLGLWIEQTEGAKFWLKVMNDLKNRGVQDILIAVVDGLRGFPEAITAVFPQALVQTCIVHLIRNSLSFVSWKDRKMIMPSLKAIYHAENADAALQRLEEFEAEWGKRYPAIGQAWRRAWQHVIPFFAFAPEIRKMIYTTNAVEALNRSLRKIIKTRGSFPTDEAAMKLLYLAIKNAGVHWRRPIAWTAAMSQFAIQFGDRFAVSAN